MRRLAAATLVLAMLAPAAGALGQEPAGAGHAASAAGQEPAAAQPSPWLTRLSSWLSAVRSHKPGSFDMPARLTGFLTEEDLVGARNDFFALLAVCKRELSRSGKPGPVTYLGETFKIPELLAILGLTADEAASGNANRVLVRAAILHADTAMIVAPLLSGRAGCSWRSTLVVADGGRVGSGCISIHWTNGRLLLDGVQPDPARDPAVRLWYHASIAYLLELGDYANAELQIERARVLFPSDPDLLFEHGYYHEGFASPYVQPAAFDAGADRRGAKVHLDEAADLYGRAVKENPHFVEARLHLGYVLTLLGRDEDAARELRLAAPAAAGLKLRYFAQLFLGGAEHALGNHAAAGDHYRQAAALYPDAQSPLLALALLARQRGDRAGARAAMQRVLALPPHRPWEADPWWTYYRWQSQDSQTLFNTMYAPFLAGGRP